MFNLNWVAKQPFVLTLSHVLHSSSFILWACTLEGMKKASTHLEGQHLCYTLGNDVLWDEKSCTCSVTKQFTFRSYEFFNFDQVPNHQELGVNLETAALELGTVLLIMKKRFFITLECIICINCSPCKFHESFYCHRLLNPKPEACTTFRLC